MLLRGTRSHENAFLFAEINRVALLERALKEVELKSQTNRVLALSVAASLPVEELKPLFPELVAWAGHVDGYTEDVWELILSLPRDWVLAHIEEVVEPILDKVDRDYFGAGCRNRKNARFVDLSREHTAILHPAVVA